MVGAAVLRKPLRRVFACVLVYALALQGIIYTLDIAASVSAAGPGFQLCSHDGGDRSQPGSPSQAPAGGTHCPFCLAGFVYVTGSLPTAPLRHYIAPAKAGLPLLVVRLIAAAINGAAWPRGPPQAA